MFGIKRSSPWEAVMVLVTAPVVSDPWTAPAAPASDCICPIIGTEPQMFFCPAADLASQISAMGEEGVIG